MWFRQVKGPEIKNCEEICSLYFMAFFLFTMWIPRESSETLLGNKK